MLIAAIISILVAIFTITSIAFDWNIFDELKNRFGTVFDTPVNQEVDANGVTLIMNGKSFTYNNIDELIEQKHFSVLYPTEFSENINLEKVILSKDGTKEKIIFVFNNSDFTYTIVLGEVVSDDIKNVSTEVQELNGIKCYIIDKSDVGIIQICFDYNNDLYLLNYNNKQDLIKVIENLKELK